MRELWAFPKDNHKRALLGWLHRAVAVLATMVCVSLLIQVCAAGEEEPSPETLARELTEAYERNDPGAIRLLAWELDERLNVLFESGELEQVTRLLQVVMPAAGKWLARSSVEENEYGHIMNARQLAIWQNLEALARNQFDPTRIVLAGSIAKDEIPLLVRVENGPDVQIYRSFNSSDEWIGQTPQHVILYPGVNRLVLGDGVEVVFTLHDGRVRVDDIHYKSDLLFGYRFSPFTESCIKLARGEKDDGACKDEYAHAKFRFISSIRQRYPTSSVLQPQENGLPSFEVPRFPTPGGFFYGGGSPLTLGRMAYRKIQIESDPTGASILIGGRPFGTTPRAIYLSSEGEMFFPIMRMILTKPGYLETVAEIRLTEPATVIHANLNPMP